MANTGTDTSKQNMSIDVDIVKIRGESVTATASELNKMDGVTASTEELNVLDGLTATTDQLNGSASPLQTLVTVTDATYTPTVDGNSNKLTLLSRAAGQAVSLPAATGSGAFYNFRIQTGITSNSTTFTADGTDVFRGPVFGAVQNTNATRSDEALGTINTVTLNGSTTGGSQSGDCIKFIDTGAGEWCIRAFLYMTGNGANPLSTT